jgi:GNAT superfamily N-acetyltransferase
MWAERLRDGAQIEIRPIGPADRDELAAGVRRLSPQSRYRRFFTPASELSEDQLTHLTEVDHHDHEALVALDPGTGHGIGVARFVRLSEEAETAEVAVAVADSWQGRGVATALLDRLAERARAEGVGRFSADILAENRPMLELIGELGDARVLEREHPKGSERRCARRCGRRHGTYCACRTRWVPENGTNEGASSGLGRCLSSFSRYAVETRQASGLSVSGEGSALLAAVRP